MSRLFYGALLLILLALAGIRFAEPVGDGDLFWQMAYGRYLVEHLTLVPDHTVYSWTPSSNSTIYCAWVAEIFFYALYSAAGLPLIFAFRYACVLLTLWLLFDYVRRLQARQPRLSLERRPEVYLWAAVMLLGCYVGTILKPEIFSLVGFHLLAWGYFTMKLEARDHAPPPGRWMWFFPLLMVFWVNSHGVFLFGLAALLVLCLGEWLNLEASPELALPRPYLRTFTLATGLSGLACFVTPYGYRYPLQLAREFLGMLGGTQSAGDAVAYASLAAHQKITDLPSFHFVLLMIIMALSLLWFWTLQARLGGRGKRVDVAVVGVNLAMAALYFWYARTTYYWPPFWAYTCLYSLYLLGSTGDRGLALVAPRFWPSVLASLAFLGICVGSILQSLFFPYASSWCGFGISLFSPVHEAEWLERYYPQSRVYNDYDGGGYLLWRLYPQTKVMVDSRSFPYRQWYADYHQFEQGVTYREFLDNFEKADVAIVSYASRALCLNLAHSGEWTPAWAGPSSVVFVRPGVSLPDEALAYAPNRFRDLKNFYRATQAFQLCMELGLHDAGFALLRAMAVNFQLPEEQTVIRAFIRYKEALEAENRDGNLDKALLLYEECRREGVFFNDVRLMELYKLKLSQLLASNQGEQNTQQIRDLGVRMSALARGQAPPMPSKKLVGPPLPSSSP